MIEEKDALPTTTVVGAGIAGAGSDSEQPLANTTATPENIHHLTGSKLYLVLVGLGLVIFLFALDISVIATAIPSITAQFNSTSDIGWYAAAYPLCLCSLQPLAGKIYVLFSLRWAYFAFVGIFLLGSLLCAVATSSNMFITARAITGVGASGIFSGTLTILAVVTPLSKRALYVSALTSLFGVATISGPVIGGALTSKVSWRWVFYINLPTGAVTLVVLFFFFKPPVRDTDKGTFRQKILKIDIIGCAIFIPTIVMILLALQWGGHKYPWNSATVIGLLCGAVVLVVIFLVWEYHKGDNAMIPFSIVLQRSILCSCLFILCYMGSYIINIYYIPEWFQVVKGASAIHSGVMSLPSVGAQVVAGIAVGLIINRTGWYNPYFFIGITCAAICSGLYTTLTPTTNHAKWITYLVLQGVSGISMQSPMLAIQAALASRPADIPVGLAAMAFFQYFGTSVFQSIALAILQNQLVRSLKSRVGLNQSQVQMLLDAGTGHARKTAEDSFPEKLPLVIWAYNKAITNVFYASTAAAIVGFVLATGIEWKNIKAKKPTLAKQGDEVRSPKQAQDVEKTSIAPKVEV